jgi:hypothetical protein
MLLPFSIHISKFEDKRTGKSSGFIDIVDHFTNNPTKTR